MLHNLVNDILTRSVKNLIRKDLFNLYLYTSNLPLHKVLFKDKSKDDQVIRQRLASWPFLLSDIPNIESELRISLKPITLWSYPLIIANFIKNHSGLIFSIIGSPGAGKTTLANLVVKCLHSLDPSLKVLRISLEDFYLSKNIRKKKGIKWRAQPGSHDIDIAVQLLRQIKNRKQELAIPRFDFVTDDSCKPEIVQGPISIVIFEGWFIGKNDLGYERINEFVDYRIFLDCDIETAKRRRFSREMEINQIHNGVGGLSNSQLNDFWNEVLQPGINKWVLPLRSNSDLIIKLGNHDWEIATAKRQD